MSDAEIKRQNVKLLIDGLMTTTVKQGRGLIEFVEEFLNLQELGFRAVKKVYREVREDT